LGKNHLEVRKIDKGNKMWNKPGLQLLLVLSQSLKSSIGGVALKQYLAEQIQIHAVDFIFKSIGETQKQWLCV